MPIKKRLLPALFLCSLFVISGCTRAAWQPAGFVGVALEPGRYLQKYYRSPNFNPAAAIYQVEPFPVEQVRGLDQEQAAALFNEELLRALTANGLPLSRQESADQHKANQPDKRVPGTEPQAGPGASILQLSKPRAPQEKTPVVLSGVVDRLEVASPTWRFFSGRGHADLRVAGEIRRGQEVVFAFQDEVRINPPINPKHRPPLEAGLIAQMAIRHFTANLLNELLLPPQDEGRENIPAAPPAR